MTQGRYTVNDIRQRIQEDFCDLTNHIDSTKEWLDAAGEIYIFTQRILTLLDRQEQLQKQEDGFREPCYEAKGQEVLNHYNTAAFLYSLKLLQTESNTSVIDNCRNALALIDDAQSIRKKQAESLGTTSKSEDLDFYSNVLNQIIASNQIQHNEANTSNGIHCQTEIDRKRLSVEDFFFLKFTELDEQTQAELKRRGNKNQRLYEIKLEILKEYHNIAPERTVNTANLYKSAKSSISRAAARLRNELG